MKNTKSPFEMNTNTLLSGNENNFENYEDGSGRDLPLKFCYSYKINVRVWPLFCKISVVNISFCRSWWASSWLDLSPLRGRWQHNLARRLWWLIRLVVFFIEAPQRQGKSWKSHGEQYCYETTTIRSNRDQMEVFVALGFPLFSYLNGEVNNY